MRQIGGMGGTGGAPDPHPSMHVPWEALQLVLAEWNVIINPAHPDAARVSVMPAFDVTWDGRLFGPAPFGES